MALLQVLIFVRAIAFILSTTAWSPKCCDTGGFTVSFTTTLGNSVGMLSTPGDFPPFMLRMVFSNLFPQDLQGCIFLGFLFQGQIVFDGVQVPPARCCIVESNSVHRSSTACKETASPVADDRRLLLLTYVGFVAPRQPFLNLSAL